ncbi:TIGR02556 family CRISPR-associated protein [Clostridium sp. MSJ-4]|uniref:TIGR02556 family CRISPR-associated protein n=1 Tax=Clostridium simiarum TaxID=2841506 RepID=A0ABS6F6X2_9CLOT|nr:TIGR02556 family CRISPR-associated protein [Clostridium simiarum]MBU5593272.1 TIGR02556 family CRISPR-associated protein [Clostridium simiarum]
MINAIRDIGAYLRENNGITEVDIVRSLVNKIEGDTVKEILLIDIKDNGEIETQSEEFYGDITTKALFYQAGNDAQGGAMRADFYKDDSKEIEKFDKKIKTTLAYCDVEDHYDEVRDIIYQKIRSQNKNFIVVILLNGKYPYDLLKDKFLDKMYATRFKSIGGKHICHFCGEKKEVFNTTTYKFYTNDKEVYGSIDEKDKFGVTMCKNCLNDILIGKQYIEDKLTTYWIDKSVMFLPHNFNEQTEAMYENSTIINEDKKNFISNIYDDEEIVLELLGKGNTETDIIFFDKDGNKTFYIQHTIKSMLPSRFSELAILLNKYGIKLYNIINFSTAIKVGLKGIETTNKEKLRIVDAIFSGKSIQRNTFFTRAMMVHKYEFINGKNKFTISNIGKVYNFLVDCGCLEGGFKVMTKYSDYKELFLDNPSYFNSSEKKAWFLIGMAYNYVNYMIKKGNSTEEGKLADRSSLDKNFFFARRFDFKDFIYFSNLLSDKMIKYRISSVWIKDMLTESKELMANPNGKLSSDEAKYIFFWGMDSYFKKDGESTSNVDTDINEQIQETGEEI